MSRKSILTAALATGVAISGAHGHQPAGPAGDVVATDPTDAERQAWAANDLLIFTAGEGDLIAGTPDVIVAPDDWGIGIEFAQTCCGNSRDRITSGGRTGNITLDNGIKRGNNITLDNGIKKGGKVKLNSRKSGNRTKGNRKKRKR